MTAGPLQMTLLLVRTLTVLSAALAALLLMVMLLIARFYQRTSGEHSAYGLFLISAVLFVAAGLRYAWLGAQPASSPAQTLVAGDPAADLLRFAGGSLLVFLCLFLYRLMTGRRR